MRNIHNKYIKRELESILTEYLNYFSVVGLTGPRQSGKSTLLQHCLPDYQYVTFDDYKIKELFYSDKDKFISIYNNKIIFDEVHHVPELFDLIKLTVDMDRGLKGRFVLTGSAQFKLMRNISESLAGRIGLLTLLPFSFKEVKNLELLEMEYKGCYPELVTSSYKYSDKWYSSYIETYLEKDIKLLSNIGDLRDFSRLISLLAARTSQQLNMSDLSKELGVSVSTIKRWVSILEATYIIFLLQPYFKNLGKRIVKTPKVYFYDTGLVSYLTGIETVKMYNNGPMAGPIFENYLISEIYKNIKHQDLNHNLYFFRTNHGEEIDLIVDKKKLRELIEIKKSMTFKSNMIKTVEKYIGDNEKGYLLYSGEKFPYLKNIEIINYKDYLSR